MAKDNDKAPIIIIKRVKKVEGGHHGGAWKVAYADFVTAMMAFFLLLWLLNVTTAKQRDMISAYFAPTDPRISESTSGAGGVMGGTSMSSEGAMTDDKRPIAAPSEMAEGVGKNDPDDESKARKELEALDKQDENAFEKAQEKIRRAIESVPELKELAQNILIDVTPEGLRIQLVDQEGKPMFELGSAKPLPQAEKVLRLVAQVVQDLPNKISIRGHTDAKPFAGTQQGYTNWELSADRANASRRIMLLGGLDSARLENVQGRADREPLVPEQPESARNRRISIILLKQSIAASAKKNAIGPQKPSVSAPAQPEPKKREEGVIYFP
jgi:chemotaxis protein MotB